MKNMTTDVSALEDVYINHFEYNDFSSEYLSYIFEELKKLADKLKKGQEATYEDGVFVRKMLVRAKIFLKLDQENDVHITCFYYKQLNNIAKKYKEMDTAGLVEHFYPTASNLTEAEKEHQINIKELLGI